MTTDTSAEAIESAWEEFEISSKPTGESDGYEMFNVEGMGDDAWNIIVITRALAAERDALRLQLAEARNAALEDVMDHSWLAFHKCDFEVQVVSVRDIEALKTTGEDSNG